MITIYYLFVILLLLLAGPFLLCWKKARAGIWQKLGIVPDEFASRLKADAPKAWFHAVSVGEFNALYPLLLQFHEQFPQYQICVSTTTATGQNLATERVGEWANIFYFPLDLPIFTNNWLDIIKPQFVATVETEIWPGFVNNCYKRGIKMFHLNGRISPRSFKRYLALRNFWASVFQKIDAFLVQSEAEAQRFKAFAVNNAAIFVTGNLKFDGISAIAKTEQEALKSSLNLRNEDLLLVAGSTHEGEEKILLETLQGLADTKAKLLIAPRHPERFDRIAKLIESFGYIPKRASLKQYFESDKDVYLLDSIGHLAKHYSLAKVAFVGGTLAPIGGHSLVEPCVYGLPVITGPYLDKTRNVANSLSELGVLTVVKDKDEFVQVLNKFFDSAEARQAAGEKGKDWLAQCQGAVARTLSRMTLYIDDNQIMTSDQTVKGLKQ